MVEGVSMLIYTETHSKLKNKVKLLEEYNGSSENSTELAIVVELHEGV